MKPYFEQMPGFGRPLGECRVARAEENIASIREVQEALDAAAQQIRQAGLSVDDVNARGELSVWQRLDYLVDPGTWCPLHTLFNPAGNPEGCTSVVDGLGKISGRWAVIVGFDNKISAGAWVAGQAENSHRATDLAKRLNVPLVWLVNCSGLRLPDQHLVYGGRRSGGSTFYRHADLQKSGVPVLAAVYGSNPAGGGYQSISPTVIFAHKDANMSVGGAAIVGGMNPQGYFDEESCEALIENTRKLKATPPGRREVHHDATGFFRCVSDTEQGVLDDIKEFMAGMPAYDPKMFRVAEPRDPKFAPAEIDSIVPSNQKRVYTFTDVLARLVDGSEHLEFKPGYGPEIYCGLVRVDGFLCGAIGNNQGMLAAGYPEYADYPGIGGRLYRQGLIKMSEFVTLCGRDRIPLLWFQDTTGIDVGDAAERAELLGLGQALIYSIEQTDVPQMLTVLRKGSAASHYVMCGPQANHHNAFTLGTPTTEIYVMHSETAAAASYARRLVKEKDAGRPLGPVIEKMNRMVQEYHDHSRPRYCAEHGLVDEVVRFADLRRYLVAFAGSAYQNPKSVCPQHLMILPRLIRELAKK